MPGELLEAVGTGLLSPTSQAGIIIEAVKAGNLGKAITLIDSNGVAPFTPKRG